MIKLGVIPRIMMFLFTSVLSLAVYAEDAKTTDHSNINAKQDSLSDTTLASSFLPDFFTSDQLREYLAANQQNIMFLTETAEQEPVDFSSYTSSMEPALINNVTQMPNHIRLMMADVEYAGLTENRQRAATSLMTALRLNQRIAQVPYLYGQLVWAGDINIIYDKLQKSSVDVFALLPNDKLREIEAVLKNMEASYSQTLKNSLRFEANLDNKVLESVLSKEVNHEFSSEMPQLIAEYRQLFELTSEKLGQPFDDAWLSLLSDAKALSCKFNVPILSPLQLQNVYYRTISRIRTLRVVCSALIYYNDNKELPLWRDQFFPKDILADTVVYLNYKRSTGGNGFVILSAMDEVQPVFSVQTSHVNNYKEDTFL